jgi:hypothetical protein
LGRRPRSTSSFDDRRELASRSGELTPEEIEDRLSGLGEHDFEEAKALQRILRTMGTEWPRAKLNVEALVNMSSSVELLLAIKALSDEECRWALHNVLYSLHKLHRTPEEFDKWSIPPEFWPEDYEPPSAA